MIAQYSHAVRRVVRVAMDQTGVVIRSARRIGCATGSAMRDAPQRSSRYGVATLLSLNVGRANAMVTQLRRQGPRAEATRRAARHVRAAAAARGGGRRRAAARARL